MKQTSKPRALEIIFKPKVSGSMQMKIQAV